LIAVNFLISPLWEEIIWRGYVLGAFRTEMSELRAVFFSCGLWTLWHFGLLVAQVHEGLPLVIICLLPVQYFCVGVFLCWLYKSSEGALYPCVLFHGTLNAAKVAYYTSGYNRTVEVGSYVSETVGMLILMVVSVYLLGKVVAPGDVASSEGSKGL
jgi:membrane protease YdiL (CAAX protease family)